MLPFLNSGVTWAFFHSVGTDPDFNEILKRCVSGTYNTDLSSNNTLLWIPSGPGDFDTSSFSNAFKTYSSSITQSQSGKSKHL